MVARGPAWINGRVVVPSRRMNLKDYTVDNICRAMLLPGFIEDSWTQSDQPVLRLVLTPSFSPEVCLTITHRNDQTIISVDAFVEQFWLLPSPVQSSPCNFEEVICESNVFDHIVNLFEMAEEKSKQKLGYICIDGMGIETCLISRGCIRQFKFHVANQEPGGFVSQTIAKAWNGCRDPQIRNALAHCAFYLGERYSLEEMPPKVSVVNLAILGTPSEKHEYLEKLRLQKKALKK